MNLLQLAMCKDVYESMTDANPIKPKPKRHEWENELPCIKSSFNRQDKQINHKAYYFLSIINVCVTAGINESKTTVNVQRYS